MSSGSTNSAKLLDPRLELHLPDHSDLKADAIRHGLTAETVIGALEDGEDYAAFEKASL